MSFGYVVCMVVVVESSLFVGKKCERFIDRMRCDGGMEILNENLLGKIPVAA